jgi:hypothetical protein
MITIDDSVFPFPAFPFASWRGTRRLCRKGFLTEFESANCEVLLLSRDSPVSVKTIATESNVRVSRTRLFVLSVGCSWKSVLRAFRSWSAHTWAELGEEAFRRLSGALAPCAPAEVKALYRVPLLQFAFEDTLLWHS